MAESQNLYRKKALPVGVHHAPEGDVVVTPQRVKRWVEKFNELKADGVNFPTPWGHLLSAVPKHDKEGRKRVLAEGNAGYIERLEQDPVDGSLIELATVPPGWEAEKDAAGNDTGDLINRDKGTRIREVSVAIGNWRDGKGRRHEDIILHAALVPLPVWHGQTPFQALATSADPSAEFLFGLSTGSFKMAKDDKDKDKDKDKDDTIPDSIDADTDSPPVDDDGPPVDDAPLIDAIPDAPIDPIPAPPAPPDPLTMDADKVAQLTTILNGMGANLPMDTTPANFLDRVLTQLMVFQKLGVTLTPKAPAAPDQSQAATVDVGTDGLTAEQPQLGAGSGLTMMSTVAGETVTLDAGSWKFAKKAGEKLRKRIAADWVSLAAGRPDGFKQVCEDEADRVATFTLAIDPDGDDVTVPEAVARLELAQRLTESLGHADLAAALTQTLSTAIPEVTPNVQADADKGAWLQDLLERTQGSGAKLGKID